jgi:DNA mismatch repair protein MutS2
MGTADLPLFAIFATMIYPSNFELKIDFNQIRDLVSQQCVSEMGRKFVRKMHFTAHFAVIQKMLEQNMEFVRILESGKSFPIQNYIDCREELSRLKTEGAYIEQEALFDLKLSLETLWQILEFFKATNEDEYPRLKAIIGDLFFPQELLNAASAIIDDKGNIRDNASSELMEIRQKLQSKARQVMRETRKAFNQARQSGWLPDHAEITIRNGRAVIPVKASDKRALQGFIHDESASGQTIFIEPMASVEVNNEIVELENKERREIIRILTRFTNRLRPYLSDLHAAYRIMGLMDFIRAKALFASKINATVPRITTEKVISIKHATHPLLYLSHKQSGKEVVPLDLELDAGRRILIISGPNAGGKSVCLKTVGLLQYMLQCGLAVPVSPDSQFRIFDKLFIDIGDEQSLENDLSTYSSHLLNMKHFLRHANAQSLVLIDEFGTGTEPQLGGAIAEATLGFLVKKETFGVITTHYTNLKLAAERMEGLVNGAMLFDVKELKPLYQLKIGKPGSSFAFEIARKIGFPNYALNRARKIGGGKHLRFDAQLQQLEADKISMNKKQEELRKKEEELAALMEKYTLLNDEIEKQKKQILKKAQENALEVVRQSNREIEKTIREIKESQADKETTKKARQQLDETKRKLELGLKRKENPVTRKKKRQPIEKKVYSADDLGKVSEGDRVQVVESDIIGDLISIQGENAVVDVNGIRLKIATKKLVKTKNNPKKRTRKTDYSNIMHDIHTKAASFELSLDLRGKRAEEAMEVLQKYIDDAILLNVKEVSILHGKGFGILREIIREYLLKVPEVVWFGDAAINLGGAGITNVKFR